MTDNTNPHICLVQPPLTQLNCPYPAVYYLRSFFEQRGYTVTVRDHSIGLFERIFCRSGLARIFTDICGLGTKPDPIVESFLSDKDRWLAAIDRTVAFLQGQDHEWGHLIALANDVLPKGVNHCLTLMDLGNFKRKPSVEDAPLLASKLLADIANLITNTLDKSFSLVRYVPEPLNGVNTGFSDFSAVTAVLDGYVMRTFYRPLLKTEWKRLAAETKKNGKAGNGLFLGVSIPFPGCLAGALVCAQSAKAFFGRDLVTVAGGGYVNTELRFIEEEKLFDYFDYLSFDRGYGSWNAILGKEKKRREGNSVGRNYPLYKTMYRTEKRCILRCTSISGINGTGEQHTDKGIAEGQRIDDRAVRSIFPDYSGVNFSHYIRPVDDTNSMHRLWSDGRWLKAYTAHGCYWHNCAFCDTSLDYIRCYQSVNIGALFRHLTDQAEKTGVRGVHLVDEACSLDALVRLALLNRQAGLPLLFWGNIRFEKVFTVNAAAILASGGFLGVSAGIEIATEKGFARIGKGIGLKEVVNACAAFKEAGILVHAYLIYGYWDETDDEVVESAEILRQLFEAGLLDSAFWHRFVLTVHSRIYAEKRRGQHPALRIASMPKTAQSGKIFALNDLSIEKEKRFNRFAFPLDMLLQSWMLGDTSQPVMEAFPFSIFRPTVAPDLVEKLLGGYIRQRKKDQQAQPRYVIFLASEPVLVLGKKGVELHWRWRFEDCLLRATPEIAKQTAALLKEASKGNGTTMAFFFNRLKLLFENNTPQVWKQLRRQGLCAFG